MTTSTASELVLGHVMFLSDGRILEVFTRSGQNIRIPIDYLSVKIRGKGDKSTLNIGHYNEGREPLHGLMCPIRGDDLPAFTAFIQECSPTAIVD